MIEDILKCILHNLIDPSQKIFVKGRQISKETQIKQDTIECVDNMKNVYLSLWTYKNVCFDQIDLGWQDYLILKESIIEGNYHGRFDMR